MSTNILPAKQRREMSDLQKGKILGLSECQMPLAQIAAAVGRNRQTVKSFLDNMKVPLSMSGLSSSVAYIKNTRTLSIHLEDH